MSKLNYGWGWRRVDGLIQKKVSVELPYAEGALENFISAVRAGAEGLLEPEVDVVHFDYDWGEGCGARIEITGWRWATAEEIAEKEAQMAEEAKRQEAWRLRLLEDTKRNFPELFK